MQSENIYLKVPFLEKDEVKSLGAKWDRDLKKWYVPTGLDLRNFSKWLNQSLITPSLEQLDQVQLTSENLTMLEDLTIKDASELNLNDKKGITLSQLLQKISRAIKHITPELEWIKAEISEVWLHKTTGNCYLDLVETNNGELLSKVKAIIPKKDYLSLIDNFKNLTGDQLKPGMQILVLVKINFSIQYGLSLYIKDLDPSYTIGDLAIKLAKIRKDLQQEGLYNLNKKLLAPADFTKLVILSPAGAAGLGDFNREANLLQKHGLCNFHYYTAQFQGKEAASEIIAALNRIFVAHQSENFDALVIIRGGGAIIDLAWLNDYAIAKLICQSPMIVFSGIGHERDNTIIDEVAGCRFDTPSKVIAQIFNTIVNNANSIETYAAAIKHMSSNLYINKSNQTKYEFNQILKLSELIALETSQKLQQQYTNIVHKILNLTEITKSLINDHYGKIQQYININLQHLDEKLKVYYNNIKDIIISLHYNATIELPKVFKQIWHEIDNNSGLQAEVIQNLFKEIHIQIEKIQQRTHLELKELLTNIISLGPRAILARGYTITRDCTTKVLTSKDQAKNHEILQIEFHDGIITTKYIGE